MPDACYHCGAVGSCFPNCQCRRCLDPAGYHSYVRNLPGNNASKAKTERETRIRLELHGQQSMQPEIWNREKMFSALRDKLVLILERALEKIKSAKDGLSALSLAAASLREFSGLMPDLIEFTKEETWQ